MPRQAQTTTWPVAALRHLSEQECVLLRVGCKTDVRTVRRLFFFLKKKGTGGALAPTEFYLNK